MQSDCTLNEVFSSLSAKRRYEVWFVRLGLANGAGAFWFRYLLLNPGRTDRSANPKSMPVQVWGTWFLGDAPQTIVQGFPIGDLDLSAPGKRPFHFRIMNNEIGENLCRGNLQADGHILSWDLLYRSTFNATLSNKGWIGFSRTPHSSALFSGQITLDGKTYEGNPLGFGVQGHNCGYKHRSFWTWAHLYFSRPNGAASTLEALVYDMPLGLRFRKAVLWHLGRPHVFRNLQDITRDTDKLQWRFRASTRDGWQLEVEVDGHGSNIHRLDYKKTDCSGSFQVLNNSLAGGRLFLRQGDGAWEELETATGAVLEMAGGIS